MKNKETGSVCLYAVGHDPNGVWASHFERINEPILSLDLVADKQISFTPRTATKKNKC